MGRREEKITGIILAGGKGKRLGEDKCLFKVGPKSVFDTTVDKLSAICKEIILVTECRHEHSRGVRIVRDEVPNQGPLRGIISGLKATHTSYSLVVGVDMPFLNQELLKLLVKQVGDNSVVIPESPKGLEPLCAIYSKSCVEPIARELSEGNFKITSFFEKVNLKTVTQDDILKVDPQLLSFFNINTSEDLNLARKIYFERENLESA